MRPAQRYTAESSSDPRGLMDGRSILAKWRRDEDLSLAERLWKARQFAMSAAVGPLWTHNADHVGARVRCIGRPRLVNLGVISLGDHVVLRSRPVAVELATSRRGRLRIGDHTSINTGTSVHADQSVTIGDRVRIGPYVHIMDTTFHTVSPDRTRPEPEPIEIGDDVWICVKSTILPGVHIGRGAVIGSNSVVTGNVASFTIVAGSPAKVIGEVPTEEAALVG